MSKTKPTSHSSKGFTIVELLIVIVVLGILAAIVMVSYSGIQQRAREATVRSNLLQIRQKIALYEADNGVYPFENDEIVCIQQNPPFGCRNHPIMQYMNNEGATIAASGGQTGQFGFSDGIGSDGRLQWYVSVPVDASGLFAPAPVTLYISSNDQQVTTTWPNILNN